LPFPSSLLRTISTGFILLCSYMDTKYIHHVYPHAPFPCVHPPPTDTHPWKRFIFPSCPSYFKIKYILIVQGGFALVLLVCMYCTFTKLTPSLLFLTYSLSPYSLNIQQLTV
jgi:hypothetical protein